MPKKAKELGPLAISRLNEPGMHFVGGVPGLALQVLPTLAKTWVLRATIGGKRRDMGLGGYSQAGNNVARAREAALEARKKIKAGVDPIEEARAAQSTLRASRAAALTFEQCAELYIKNKAPEWKNAKHAQQWRNTLAAYAGCLTFVDDEEERKKRKKAGVPALGGLLVKDVGLAHVLEVLEQPAGPSGDPMWTTKTETASRLRSRIELVLDLAAARGFRSKENPARWRGHLDKMLGKPSKVSKVEHHPALHIDEIGEFMQRLRELDGMGARALEFAILTATRSGEVRGATWHEIDLKAGLWKIPADRMKAGREHRVPLSEAAVKLLEALPRVAGTDLVFPGMRAGKMLSDMTLTAVTRRMGTSAVPHGFRSTFRDWAAERTTFPHEMAEMALAHAIGDKAEAAYRRGDMLEKRRAMMDQWARFCAKPEPKGEVIPMKRNRAAR